MREQIQTRRDALAEQMAQAQQQHAELEAIMKELDRQLCAMAGGLQELDSLLETDKESECLLPPSQDTTSTTLAAPCTPTAQST